VIAVLNGEDDKAEFRATHGQEALDAVLKSEGAKEAFVALKGPEAYTALTAPFEDEVYFQARLVTRLASKDARDLFKANHSQEALEAILKSKDMFVALKGPEAYAEVISGFKDEKTPHQRLVAKLNGKDDTEEFVRIEGVEYYHAMRHPGKEKDRFVMEEGAGALRSELGKYRKDGINPKAKGAYALLKALLTNDPKRADQFRAAEAEIVYNGLMGRIHTYVDRILLDELTYREHQLTREKAMDQRLGRDPIITRSSGRNLSIKIKGEIGEHILPVLQEHTGRIFNGFKDDDGEIPGYKTMLLNMGSQVTREKIGQLYAQMAQAGIVRGIREVAGFVTQLNQQLRKQKKMEKKAFLSILQRFMQE
ncbi:hypothetical protein ACFLZ6_02415, partial [Nanoarchaeota archaeon]